MAASLSSDGKIWTVCTYCRIAIWRYPRGKLWRSGNLSSYCADSPTVAHNAER